MTGAVGPVVRLDGVAVVRDGVALLDDIGWTVGAGRAVGAARPERLGQDDPAAGGGCRAVADPGHASRSWGRRSAGSTCASSGGGSPSSARRSGRTLRPAQPALDVVLTGRHAALETWWHEYTDADRARAGALLADAGFGGDLLRRPGVRRAVGGGAPTGPVGPCPDGRPRADPDGRAGGRSRPRSPRGTAGPTGGAGRRPGGAAHDPGDPSPGGDPAWGDPRSPAALGIACSPPARSRRS